MDETRIASTATEELFVKAPMKHIATIAIVIAACMLSGCDKALSGRYEEVDGAGALEFRGDRVFVTLAVVGTTFASSYEVIGSQIVIEGVGPRQVYALKSDGSIEAGAGLRFVKRQ